MKKKHLQNTLCIYLVDKKNKNPDVDSYKSLWSYSLVCLSFVQLLNKTHGNNGRKDINISIL